jgi:aryl-alcohol dehydrogenase-like predicted oxidoreductase
MTILGRTNQAFPSVWLRLAPALEGDGESQARELAGAALELGVPLDVSGQTALWGGLMRATDATLIVRGGRELEHATDASHAVHLIQAHLIQALSSIGREQIDFYVLRVGRALEEYQIEGVLEAIESARQEGHVRFLGLMPEGSPYAALGLWQFRDAFDAVFLPSNPVERESYELLAPLARERRVGIVTTRALNWGGGLPFTMMPSAWRLRNLTQSLYGLTIAQAAIAERAREHPVLVGVRNAAEACAAVEAAEKPLPEGMATIWGPFVEAYLGRADWEELALDTRPWVARAARARLGEIK